MGTLTELTPKPLLPILGIPILFWIIAQYRKYGLRKFILCTGYKQEEFLKRLSNLSPREKKILGDAEIQAIDTGEETNTGERIARVKELLKDDFCVTYGDGISTINIGKLVSWHRQCNSMATMTVIRPQSNFGVVKINQEMLAEKFIEKPLLMEWINGGFFVFKPEVLELFQKNSVLETQVLPILSSKSELRVYPHTGFWKCMDTPKDWEEMNQILRRYCENGENRA
jgi:glucose-1-phosphate cytidylyltransferase